MVDRGPYHHGELRSAFIEGARSMIRERGHDQFSLSEIARDIGVSPASAYRHFASREALLQAVCDFGFELLGQDLAREVDADDAGDRVLTIADRYVSFALREPDLFLMMFRRHADDMPTPGVNSFRPLLDAIAAAQQEGRLPEGDVAAVAGAVWVTLHGTAVLSISGSLNALNYRGTPQSLARQFLLVAYPKLAAQH